MKWFEHPADKARGFRLKAPYDRVFVGCDPRDGMTKESADDVDAFVNVSDSECNTFEPSRAGQHMHWYPVNEMGEWNLSYLFWLVKVLDHHFEAGHQIYLHCHAGAYRSPSAAILWLQSRGHSPAEALSIVREERTSLYRIWESHGNIPKLKDKVFELMRKHPTYSLGGVLLYTDDFWNTEVVSGQTRIYKLKDKYLWFYYQPKRWLRNQRSALRDWLKGYGYVRGPYCTYSYKRKDFWSWALNAEPANPAEFVFSPKRWDSENKTWVDKESA